MFIKAFDKSCDVRYKVSLAHTQEGLTVSVQMSKMEALHIYLEEQMGEDGFIEAYQEASAVCDDSEEPALSALESFAPEGNPYLGRLIGVLLACENDV